MRLLLSVSFFHASTAFVAQKQAIISPNQHAKSRYLPVMNDNMGISENETMEGYAVVTEKSENDVDDLGKEIFMANSETNAVIADAMELNAVDPNVSLSHALETVTLIEESKSEVLPLVSTPTVVDETVQAVLAVTQQAAAAAEATLEKIEVSTALAEDKKVDIVLDSNDTLYSTPPSNEVIAPPLNDEPTTITTTPVPVKPKETITAPSTAKILKFAIPAVGVWLCSPLLSLIDTSAVGVLSGTVQQAALNPAVAVTDYAALLIAFMYTGTTNLIAAARENDKGDEAAPRTTRTLIGALQLSTFVGAGLGAILFIFARTLLKAIIGNDGISPAVFDAAMKYVRIRSLGMPAAALIGSAQAACLGMQDIRSPLYVLLAAAIVNFFGDMMFVGCSNPLIGGAAGAAWATVFSQYAAVAIFMRWLRRKPQAKEVILGDPADKMNISTAILELTGKPSDENKSRRKKFIHAVKKSMRSSNKSKESSKNTASKKISSLFREETKIENKEEEGSFSVRGFLQGKLRKRDLVKLPSKDTVNDFAPYVVPVTSTQVGRVSGYVAMSHVVSSSLGTVSMAAQQVIVSLFYCLCPIADSLSLTAQSFLPSMSEKKPSIERSRALRQTLVNFFKAGGAFGAVMVASVLAIPLLSGFFTADPLVVSLVNMVVPLLVAFFAVHGVLCSAEGLLLGQKDLSFLGKMYAGFFAVVPYFMLRVKRAAINSAPGVINLTSVWKVFVSYQMFRFVAWVARAAVLQRRTEQQTPAP